MTNSRDYLLGVLLVVLALNGMERLALGLLLQDIKIDLDLSDTQLGLLTGLAFSLFYSVMGLPIAAWADRHNRINLMSVTTLLWSAALACCGLAQNFLQLLLIRVGVAVGEAGCIPPAHSLIADHFDRHERARAVAVFMLGAPASALIGYFLAGWLNQELGWRTTFMLLGLPGIVLALLMAATLRDPRTRKTSAQTSAPAPLHVLRTLWSLASFRHLVLCFSVVSFFSVGIGAWLPSFFLRSYQMQTTELGAWFAIVFGASGVAGTYLGGLLAQRFAPHNERVQLKVIALAYPVLGVLWAATFLAPQKEWAFALMGAATIIGAGALGPLFGAIQTLAPERMRAASIAIIYLFSNLIGMGLGPLAAGALSDLLAPRFGDDSLRYASLVLCPGFIWSAVHLWLATHSFQSDLARGAEVSSSDAAANLTGAPPSPIDAR